MGWLLRPSEMPDCWRHDRTRVIKLARLLIIAFSIAILFNAFFFLADAYGRVSVYAGEITIQQTSATTYSWVFSYPIPVYSGQTFEFSSKITNRGTTQFKVTRVQLSWDWGDKLQSTDVPVVLDPSVSHFWNFTVDVPSSISGLHNYTFSLWMATFQQNFWSSESPQAVSGSFEIQSTANSLTARPTTVSATTKIESTVPPASPMPLIAFLLMFVGAVIAAFGFLRYYRRHPMKMVEQVCQDAWVERPEDPPKAYYEFKFSSQDAFTANFPIDVSIKLWITKGFEDKVQPLQFIFPEGLRYPRSSRKDKPEESLTVDIEKGPTSYVGQGRMEFTSPGKFGYILCSAGKPVYSATNKAIITVSPVEIRAGIEDKFSQRGLALISIGLTLIGIAVALLALKIH